MFMLAAVFLTTCQTAFSEMQWPHGLPARQTHRNSGALSIPAEVNHASSVSLPNSGRERFVYVPPLANEIDERPALLPTLQALQTQFRKLAAAQP